MHYQRWWNHGDPLTKQNNRNRPAIDRFMMKVRKVPNGCWEWQANINPKGYAMFSADSQWQSAHRWIYQYHHGVELNPEEQIDHLCRIRHCVNPEHLEVVDNRTNVLRGVHARGPSTHCRNGHERTPENTRLNSNGWRVCLDCRRDWDNKARAEGRKPR